jgi:Protein of unknown function (DUF3237)
MSVVNQNGVTLWYGDERTPVPAANVFSGQPVSVTVGVRPSSVVNAIEIEYRVNGGATRILPATLIQTNLTDSSQLFRGDFPYFPAGSSVEYRPVLRTLGRRVFEDSSIFSVIPFPRQSGHGLATSRNPPESTTTNPREPFPYVVEQLGQVRASLAPPLVVGETPDGLRVNFAITGGEIVGRRFNARVETGGADALRIRLDGTAILAVRTTLMTHDGARIYTEYSGVLDLGPDGFQRALKGDLPSTPAVHLAPRFVSASPEYRWLNRLQCMGIGYVNMPKLEVNYDLYAMHLADTTIT